ncbi:MAG: ABC transporter permease [Acidimicrobiales bacterium]
MTFAIDTEVAPAAVRPGRLRQLWATPNGLVGLAIIAFLTVVTILAALGITPDPPLAQNPATRFSPPSADHWLGTDQFGRDVASRVMMGVLASMRVAVVAVAIASVAGSAAGIAAGFFGSWTDRIIGRVTDILFAFPAILLALAVLAALGRGWTNTVIAVAIVYTPIFVRVARGPVLTVRELDFVKAGRVLGFDPGRLLFRHVLPNVTAPIIVQIALALSWAILTESSLSFLGLGTQPPDPSLGLMVSDARTLVSRGWWLMAAPATAIVLAVIGLNLLGDGLRDAFDPTRTRPARR